MYLSAPVCVKKFNLLVSFQITVTFLKNCPLTKRRLIQIKLGQVFLSVLLEYLIDKRFLIGLFSEFVSCTKQQNLLLFLLEIMPSVV